MTGRQPMFNIPASIVATALAMIVLHAIRVALPPEESLYMLLALAFVPARYAGATPGLPGGEWSEFTSFITYMFVHGDATHLIINMVWMLAFGSAVAKRIGDLRFVIFSLLCGIAGVLLHLVLYFGELVPVVGASAAISGQMAGAIRFMFSASRHGVPMSHDLKQVPLAGIGVTLANPRFLMFLGVWIAINLLFGLGGMQLDGSGAGIAWEAHLGGFVCGLFIFGLFDRTVRSDGSTPTYVYKDD